MAKAWVSIDWNEREVKETLEKSLQKGLTKIREGFLWRIWTWVWMKGAVKESYYLSIER